MSAAAEMPAAADAFAAQIACSNCGRNYAGTFCNSCGQKRFHVGDLSLKHAWHHVMHETLHFDGKIFHSLKLLLTRPGQLTLDFIEGRRARHVHPIRLFLTLFFLFFFFAPVNPLLDMSRSLETNLLQQPELQAQLQTQADRKGVALPAVFKEAAARLNRATKPLDLALVIMNGVMYWLLFRKPRRYFAEHMVMTLHVASFTMSAQLLLGWLRLIEPARTPVGIALGVIGTIYFVLAARRVYAQRWWLALLKYACTLLVQFLIVSAVLGVLYVGYVRDALR